MGDALLVAPWPELLLRSTPGNPSADGERDQGRGRAEEKRVERSDSHAPAFLG
jgi:hypothetical protein